MAYVKDNNHWEIKEGKKRTALGKRQTKWDR
jgi:hypothetical protein